MTISFNHYNTIWKTIFNWKLVDGRNCALEKVFLTYYFVGNNLEGERWCVCWCQLYFLMMKRFCHIQFRWHFKSCTFLFRSLFHYQFIDASWMNKALIYACAIVSYSFFAIIRHIPEGKVHIINNTGVISFSVYIDHTKLWALEFISYTIINQL